MDYALSFGVGRQTTFRVEDITQTLPTGADFPETSTRSPFLYAAQMMLSYGPLINMLNCEQGEGNRKESEVQSALAQAIKQYNQLPQDMQWTVAK
jgi:hypothetical protein